MNNPVYYFRSATLNTVAIIALLISLLGTTNTIAQTKAIKSKIKTVTVFQNGAQIYRTGNTAIKNGHHIIRFSNLSNNINASSIQVKANGNFTIMSVTHQINYLKEIKKTKRIAELQDSLILLTNQEADNNQITQAYREEISLLKANKSLKANNTNLKVTEIKAAADFYRSRYREIYKNMGILDRKTTKTRAKKNLIQQQLNQLKRRKAPKGVGEILVEVYCNKATNAKFSFNYLINNAGWTPLYDIRAKDIKSKIELHYRANIYQNSGVDWKNIRIAISTGNPRQSGITPTLRPWYLNFRLKDMNNKAIRKADAYAPQRAATADYDMEDSKVATLAGASNSANFTTVAQGQTNTLFKIDLPYSIPSSNKRVNVKVQKWMLDADYRYYAAPRLDPDVFLQARITGWEDLSLLAGNVNVFFEGTYVSKSYLNPSLINDTLDISLGRDKNIVIKRTRVKNKTSKSIIGSTKKLKVAWDIEIRNNKKQKISLLLQDQIPISNNKTIEVKLNAKSGAYYDAKTGFMSWKLDIEPRTKKELNYDYQVKYPKDYLLGNLW